MNKILIIDDDLLVSNVIKQSLDDFYDVNICTDSRLGCDHILSFNPYIVLLDMVMPKMNGLQFLNEVKDKNINCKFVISTGSSQYTTKLILEDLIKEKTIHGYIFKPYDVTTLLTKINECFNEG